MRTAPPYLLCDIGGRRGEVCKLLHDMVCEGLKLGKLDIFLISQDMQ